jgi:hypothetical protein
VQLSSATQGIDGLEGKVSQTDYCTSQAGPEVECIESPDVQNSQMDHCAAQTGPRPQGIGLRTAEAEYRASPVSLRMDAIGLL